MKFFLLFLLGLVGVAGIAVLYQASGNPSRIPAVISPPPTATATATLAPDRQPTVKLTFRPDGRYVTVNITNIWSDALEYNLIYDATVKKQKIQTGVTGSAKLNGKNTYTQDQLLGSESSGKFTYHDNIQNGIFELTLRDSQGRSVFSASYPFTFTPGKSQTLTPR